MTKRLAGKVALVTGGSRGVGRAIVQRLAEEGASVAVNYLSDGASANAALEDVKAKGQAGVAIQADVSRSADVRRLFAETEEALGKIDIVIVNAGVELINTPIAEITEEQYDWIFGINTKGAFLTMQEAASRLQPNGRLIYISSSTTRYPYPGFTAYAGSKAAPNMFVDVLAKELAPRGITVNSVVPGPLDDAGVLLDAPREDKTMMASLSPFNRMGKSVDVANAVAFLASRDADWVAGHHLVANGAASI